MAAPAPRGDSAGAVVMVREAFIAKRFSSASMDVIRQSNDILNEYAAQGYTLSLRQLYYQHVARGWRENTERSYKNLGNVISDARLAGLIDWDMIKDRGRVTVWSAHWDDPAQILRASADQFCIDKWERQPAYVELMVEKDALSGVLDPVCRELDVRFTANRGYSSSSAMYEASRRFVAAANGGKTCYVLYLGDHDPSGIDMSRDILERLDLFTYHDGMTVNRLALNIDQVEHYNPPPNPTKLTDSRANGYIAQFGYTSWELDALDPNVLGDLVRHAVLSLRDEDLWEEAVEEEQQGRVALAAYAAEWERDQS